MSFLGAWWLALAGAAAVPLLLHLRRRPVSQRYVFPALRWLLRAQREHSRELRLRNLLLMVLRTAVVLVLAAAAARPIVRGLPGGHAPTALAVVLDNSLSTTRAAGGEPALDALRAAALRTLDAVTSADRAWLLTADGTVTGGTLAQVQSAVRAVSAWPGAGDLPGAVEKAATLATTVRGLAPRVVVLTDGQASTWRRAVTGGDAAVTVFVPAAAAAVASSAVVDAAPVPPRWSPRGKLRVRVTGGDSVPVTVTLGGRTLARARVAPGADAWIAASPSERGWVAGQVAAPPDALRGDDVRHFAVWIGAAPPVSAAGAGRFVQAALDALVADGRATPGEAAGTATVQVAPAEEVRRLPALLLAPRTPASVPQANATLARLGIPWRFETAVDGPAPVSGAAWMRGATASKRVRLVAAGAGDGGPSDTLARAGGEPWLVAGPRWVLAGSAFDTAATDVMLKAGFVPWLGDQLASRLAGDGGPLVGAAPGGDVGWPAPLDGLESADGNALPVAGRRFTAPTTPGVYFALRSGARAGALLVNPEAEESDVAGWSAREVSARISAASVRGVSDATGLSRLAFGSGGGAALLGPLLVLGVGLLVAEALVARHGRDA